MGTQCSSCMEASLPCEASDLALTLCDLAGDELQAPDTAKITYGKLSKAQRDVKWIDGAPHLLSRTHANVVNPVIADFLDAYGSRGK